MLAPSDVFIPNGFPTGENNVYASRVEAEGALAEGLNRRQVPVIYGEYGVGKTTLAKYYFRDEDRAGRLVHVLTVAGKNLDDVGRIALEQIGYEVTYEREQNRSAALTSEVEGGIWGAFKAKLGGQVSSGSVSRTELLVRSPTDQGFLRALADAEIVIAFDEMHKASDGFRMQLAELIKASANLGMAYPRFVVLGTTGDAGDLVQRDPGIDRLIREVVMSPMTDEEATFVVTDGMRRLEISVSDELVQRIVSTVAGAPALLQELCLDIAERVRRNERDAVDDSDLAAGVKKFLLNSQARLTSKYMLAVNTVGTRQYRKQILRAMAESNAEFVTMDALSATVSRLRRRACPCDQSQRTAARAQTRAVRADPHGC